MFLGHYAVALGAKRAEPRLSLGTLVLAAQLLDLVWPVFLLLGLEQVRIAPGLMEASVFDFVHYPISHSLAAAIGWGLLLGGLVYAVRRRVMLALVVGAAVVSHWILDVPMHRPDLPLWPGSDVMVGAGLWNSIPATLAVEFGLLAVGLLIYVRSTRPRDRVGRWSLWAMVAILVLFFLGGVFGPPPPGETAVSVGGLVLWLFVPWAYWVDRHRADVGFGDPPSALEERGADPGPTGDRTPAD